MPELPEVETIVRQLRPGLVGRTITGSQVTWARSVSHPSAAAFVREVTGRRVERLWRRAKYFVADLDDGRHLVGHLRMSGRLYLGREERHPYLRVRMSLDDGRHLVFADVRKFGRLALVRALDDALPALGPEPLGPELADGRWMRRELRARRRMLKPLLLDQSFLAGLGNIYVDEALHRARLHPQRLSHRVPGPRADALTEAIRNVLTRAIEQQGSSFDTFYRTIEGQPGNYQDEFAVYGRQGKPCLRCGSTVHKMVVAQRGTHVCRRCQRAPR